MPAEPRVPLALLPRPDRLAAASDVPDPDQPLDEPWPQPMPEPHPAPERHPDGEPKPEDPTGPGLRLRNVASDNGG